MTNVARGFLVVEAVVAIAVFALFAGIAFEVYRVTDIQSDRAAQKERALYLAEEGLEATRAIRDGGFSYLTDGAKGLALVSSAWQFSGTNDYTNGFQRVVTISTVDANTKHATSTVSWSQRGATTTVALGTRLTNWKRATGAAATTINTSGACVYTLDPRILAGVTLVNDGSAGAVSITQVQASWVSTSQTLAQIYAPYPTSVWTGSSASGGTVTLTTPIAFTAAGSRGVALRWGGSVSGKNFTLNFIFSDGSSKSATITSPLISVCI